MVGTKGLRCVQDVKVNTSRILTMDFCLLHMIYAWATGNLSHLLIPVLVQNVPSWGMPIITLIWTAFVESIQVLLLLRLNAPLKHKRY